ncbi:MAG: hypothetical protein VX835_00390 [Pseudomonadota bacterium]|nr:hypothetical protein [Pseudomonadota bacterium]
MLTNTNQQKVVEKIYNIFKVSVEFNAANNIVLTQDILLKSNFAADRYKEKNIQILKHESIFLLILLKRPSAFQAIHMLNPTDLFYSERFLDVLFMLNTECKKSVLLYLMSIDVDSLSHAVENYQSFESLDDADKKLYKKCMKFSQAQTNLLKSNPDSPVSVPASPQAQKNRCKTEEDWKKIQMASDALKNSLESIEKSKAPERFNDDLVVKMPPTNIGNESLFNKNNNYIKSFGGVVVFGIGAVLVFYAAKVQAKDEDFQPNANLILKFFDIFKNYTFAKQENDQKLPISAWDMI